MDNFLFLVASLVTDPTDVIGVLDSTDFSSPLSVYKALVYLLLIALIISWTVIGIIIKAFIKINTATNTNIINNTNALEKINEGNSYTLKLKERLNYLEERVKESIAVNTKTLDKIAENINDIKDDFKDFKKGE